MTTYRLEQDFRQMRVDEDGRPTASIHQTRPVPGGNQANAHSVGYTATTHTHVPSYEARGYSGNPPKVNQIEISVPPKSKFIRPVEPSFSGVQVSRLGPEPYKPPEQYRSTGQAPEPYRQTSGDVYRSTVQSQVGESRQPTTEGLQNLPHSGESYKVHVPVEPYQSTGQSPEPAVYQSGGQSAPSYPYRPTPAAPRTQANPGNRSPSPMQERRDFDTMIPQYTCKPGQQGGMDRMPQGVSSRIMTTTPIAPVSTGYAQSRHTSASPPPPPPPPVAPVSTSYGQSRHTSASPPPPPPPIAPVSTGYGQSRQTNAPLPPPPAHDGIPYRPLGQSMAPMLAGPRPYTANSTGAGAVNPATVGRMPDPRPYQLKPTLDAHSGERQDARQSPVAGGKKPEAELDALTNLLMQNMEASADPDFFGVCVNCGQSVVGNYNGCSTMGHIYHISCFRCLGCGMCAKCGQPIKGDSMGCTALDQMFHIECFTCISCGVGLKGRPFFAMEGKPYCEACYMNTLEKCSVCTKPITDRILRATGKPYHPGCFICVVCGRNLDGVPFTVDATSQIHCIEDFHKKFAPRCCVCNQPIIPQAGQEETVRVVAMDRSFHVHCYTCEDCGDVLSSESEGRGCYPLDDHILCKTCNARRIQKLTTKMTTDL